MKVIFHHNQVPISQKALGRSLTYYPCFHLLNFNDSFTILFKQDFLNTYIQSNPNLKVKKELIDEVKKDLTESDSDESLGNIFGDESEDEKPMKNIVVRKKKERSESEGSEEIVGSEEIESEEIETEEVEEEVEEKVPTKNIKVKKSIFDENDDPFDTTIKDTEDIKPSTIDTKDDLSSLFDQEDIKKVPTKNIKVKKTIFDEDDDLFDIKDIEKPSDQKIFKKNPLKMIKKEKDWDDEDEDENRGSNEVSEDSSPDDLKRPNMQNSISIIKPNPLKKALKEESPESEELSGDSLDDIESPNIKNPISTLIIKPNSLKKVLKEDTESEESSGNESPNIKLSPVPKGNGDF